MRAVQVDADRAVMVKKFERSEGTLDACARASKGA